VIGFYADTPSASGTYRAAVRRLPSTRARRDAWLAKPIRRVCEANYGVYGAQRRFTTDRPNRLLVADSPTCRPDPGLATRSGVSLVQHEQLTVPLGSGFGPACRTGLGSG